MVRHHGGRPEACSERGAGVWEVGAAILKGLVLKNSLTLSKWGVRSVDSELTMIRNQYAQIGVDQFYRKHSHNYTNPHENIIHQHLEYWMESIDPNLPVLDLCSGSGEVTRYLQRFGYNNIIGCDPYTFDNYTNRTGCECLNYDFKHIATIGIPVKVDWMVCSFAMHLCNQSLLPMVLYQLSLCTNILLVITPTKKPIIDTFFKLCDYVEFDRVKSRLYTSDQYK